MRKIMVSVLILLLLTVSIIREQHAVQSNGTANNPKSDTDLPKEITGKDGAPMVLIPAGEFQMGTDPSEIPELVQWASKWYWNLYSSIDTNAFIDEIPRHTIYVDAFYMDVYEVTNAQWRKFIGHDAPLYVEWDNESIFNAPNQPIVGLRRKWAESYAEWAGKRLPTEAEWEKAARGGLVGKKFPWGDTDPDGTQCNFADKNTGFLEWRDWNVDDGYHYTAPVGSYLPNGYGLFDMAGNGQEWCADWYDKDYYAKSPKQNPKCGTKPVNNFWDTGPVCRGGSWKYGTYNLRVADRAFCILGRDDDIGFRCVQDIPK